MGTYESDVLDSGISCESFDTIRESYGNLHKFGILQSRRQVQPDQSLIMQKEVEESETVPLRKHSSKIEQLQ